MTKEHETLLELVSDKYPIPLMEENHLVACECVGFCKALLSMQPSNKDIEYYKSIALGIVAKELRKFI